MGSQLEQYNIAKEKFELEYAKLKAMVETDIPEFKEELADVGIKWTMGDFPVL